jgi:hypothetical protein
LLNRYYSLITMESGRLYPQVDLDLIRELPFPAKAVNDVSRLAELTLARERATSDGVTQTQIEAEIDGVVARFYGLV